MIKKKCYLAFCYHCERGRGICHAMPCFCKGQLGNLHKFPTETQICISIDIIKETPGLNLCGQCFKIVICGGNITRLIIKYLLKHKIKQIYNIMVNDAEQNTRLICISYCNWIILFFSLEVGSDKKNAT